MGISPARYYSRVLSPRAWFLGEQRVKLDRSGFGQGILEVVLRHARDSGHRGDVEDARGVAGLWGGGGGEERQETRQS